MLPLILLITPFGPVEIAGGGGHLARTMGEEDGEQSAV